MNERLNQAVIDAVGEIFQTVLGIKVNNTEPVEKDINENKYELNVVISILGEISGTITLKSSKKLSSLIASKMLGVEVEEDSDDMKDAAREFLNIIMGGIKRHYSSENLFDISVPILIIGGDCAVYTKARRNDKVSLIDFNYNSDHFCVEIYLK